MVASEVYITSAPETASFNVLRINKHMTCTLHL